MQTPFTTILSFFYTIYARVLRISKPFIHLFVSLITLITVCFFLMHVLPGDPFQDEQGVPEEVMQAIRHKWGLDKPLYLQYAAYLHQLAQGDLGPSMRYPSETVVGIISNGFPISAQLGLQALFLALLIGIPLGTLSARYANNRLDISTTIGSTLGISVPSFVIAASLQLLFALYWPIFPVARWGSFQHTILPSIALAVSPMCATIRMMRASTLDSLSKEWVITARMKGLSEWRILLFHVIPNSILPIIHYLGPITANLLVGSFVVERVFGIPGLGQWFVNSVMTRDYPVIAGLTLFYSIILFSMHSFIEFVSILFDSRLQTQKEAAR